MIQLIGGPADGEWVKDVEAENGVVVRYGTDTIHWYESGGPGRFFHYGVVSIPDFYLAITKGDKPCS